MMLNDNDIQIVCIQRSIFLYTKKASPPTSKTTNFEGYPRYYLIECKAHSNPRLSFWLMQFLARDATQSRVQSPSNFFSDCFNWISNVDFLVTFSFRYVFIPSPTLRVNFCHFANTDRLWKSPFQLTQIPNHFSNL